MKFTISSITLFLMCIPMATLGESEVQEIKESSSVKNACSSREVSNGCTACFKAINKLKVGYRVGGFHNMWNAGNNPDEIYLNENPSPVKFSTPYPEVVRQFGTFVGMWQGISYTDPRYGSYIPIASGQELIVLKLDPSYKVGLLELTPEIIKAGRDSYIFELQYITKYWEVGRKQATTLKSCVSYYPDI